MSTHNWEYNRSKERIEKQLAKVDQVEIKEYTREMSLDSIPTAVAYRVDAAHLYLDITNMPALVTADGEETESNHKKVISFLNRHTRAVDRILINCGVKKVDFHNQRLHAVVTKPYNDDADDKERSRIERAVAIAQLISDVLDQTGDDDADIPDAVVRVGIDSGQALAVNNGRHGAREPLFLGNPANHAAHHGMGDEPGIFLTNHARKTTGLAEVDESADVPLTEAEIEACQEAADLEVTTDEILEAWQEDLKKYPIKAVEFSRHTPPMKGLNLQDLTPANSRRQEQISVYADIDGFTSYVDNNIDENAEDVVRCLHVIRSELDAVLSLDFEGLKVRFVGDCIHGVMVEGTAQTTDAEESVTDAAYCAGGLRSGFDVAIEQLDSQGVDTTGLGLQIGFDYGPTALTRIGLKGQRSRCVISRAVCESDAEQSRCEGNETAIGEAAYEEATAPVQSLFEDRKAEDLDYNEVVQSLAESGDEEAQARIDEISKGSGAPSVVVTSDKSFRPHCAGL